MIIREAPIDNAWYRAAVAWFVALFAVNCFAWPVFDHYDLEVAGPWSLAVALPAGALALFLIGKLTPAPTRVLAYVFIIGTFGFVPLVAGLLLPITTLLLLMPATSPWALMLAVSAAVSSFWINLEVRKLSAKIVQSKYLEREFIVQADAVYVNRAPQTELDTTRTGKEAIARWIAAALALSALLGYAMQNMIVGQDRVPSTVLILAILGTPLAIYVLCRMACDAYLWIYTVWKLERQHGKHVHLSNKSPRTY